MSRKENEGVDSNIETKDVSINPSLNREAPPASIKELSIGPDTGTGDSVLKRFMPVIEMVVRKEYKSIPSYLAEYGELVNVGLLTVNKLLKDVKESKKIYNSSYIAQAVKWAIKDELRTKYNWYGIKQTQQKEESKLAQDEMFSEGVVYDISEQEATEKVFETILYLEDMPVEKPIEEMDTDELARLELKELKQAIKRAVEKLPEKHRMVMELRFYQGKRGNDVAEELGVTPSRISHMIQDAIEKIRQSLAAEGFT